MKTKKIEIEIKTKGFENGLSRNYRVNFDKQRFQQIFLNYLSNAVKFVRGPGNIKAVLFKIPSSG